MKEKELDEREEIDWPRQHRQLEAHCALVYSSTSVDIIP